MDRAVALKVLPGAVAADERALQRFVREAKVAGDLHHPNVVPVHDMLQTPRGPCLVTDLIEGEELADLRKLCITTAERVMKEQGAEIDYLIGTMIESFLVAGRQDWRAEDEMVYGQSITDPCIGWEDTEPLLYLLAEAVRQRRGG